MQSDDTDINVTTGTQNLPGCASLDAAILKRLAERNDEPGLRRLAGHHLAIIIATGSSLAGVVWLIRQRPSFVCPGYP